MPLVGHLPLATFDELRESGQDVLFLEQALKQDIRELHIGFLNMMPDAALATTERQFLRLIGSCNQIAQFYVHPFSIPGLERGPEARSYIGSSYETFEKIRREGLDALIITGANVANPELEMEPLWEPLQEVISWAAENVTSVLCSCLATHALLKSLYGIARQPLSSKRWGVYKHCSRRLRHPLLRDINTLFDVPHSRHNEVTREQLEAAGLTVLVESSQGDVHLAVSPDRLRFVFMQGHPEYDYNSLLKEYKREVSRFVDGARSDYPPVPENYFGEQAAEIADGHRQQVESDLAAGVVPPAFPEEILEEKLHNTWGDTGKAVFNNWLGLVYRLTNLNRLEPFAPGIDPADPLRILAVPPKVGS